MRILRENLPIFVVFMLYVTVNDKKLVDYVIYRRLT